MHSVAAGLITAATMFVTAAIAQTRLVTEEMMVKSPDPGIEIYVRNKRPADMGTFRPERTVLYVHGATYPASTVLRPTARRNVVDGLHRRARLRRLPSRSARLWEIHTPEGNVGRSEDEPTNRAWRLCGERHRDGR